MTTTSWATILTVNHVDVCQTTGRKIHFFGENLDFLGQNFWKTRIFKFLCSSKKLHLCFLLKYRTSIGSAGSFTVGPVMSFGSLRLFKSCSKMQVSSKKSLFWPFGPLNEFSRNSRCDIRNQRAQLPYVRQFECIWWIFIFFEIFCPKFWLKFEKSGNVAISTGHRVIGHADSEYLNENF